MAGQFDIHPLVLKAGSSQRIESTLRPVQYLIVTVTTGVLRVWSGDNASPTGLGHWSFKANWPPQVIPLLPQRTIGSTAIITVQAGLRDVQATVTFYGGPEPNHAV